MAQPEVRMMLFERETPSPEGMTEDVRYLLDHLVTAAVLLTEAIDAYDRLLERRGLDVDPDSIRGEAIDLAERLGSLLQSLGRRRDLTVAAQETALNPSAVLAILNQLFCSFCLLAGDDELTESGFDAGEAARWLELLDVDAWFDELGLQSPLKDAG